MRFLNDLFPLALLTAIALAALVFANAAGAQVPEPQGYWMGPLHGEVPDTLTGARVLGTKALEELLQKGIPVLIDAASVLHRPENLPPAAVWMPVPHQNIPGSVWFPGIGEGKLAASLEAYYQEQLRALTGKDPDRQIVFYCHPQCWASWNAAKRALAWGYRNAAWYRDGAEGWQDADHPLVTAKPAGPAQTSR
jgi:PQQ-dependent catabolism-associated CXXCW motif protein